MSDVVNISGVSVLSIAPMEEKTTLASGDAFLIEDSEAEYTKKKFLAANLPAGGGGGGLTQPQILARGLGA